MAAINVDPINTASGFGELLREHRLAMGLTQETLAERAGLSAHAVQRLERGSSQPYRDTAERLIRALQLSEQDQVRFRAAARPAPRVRQPQASAKPAVLQRASHNLPHQTTSFVGREDDLANVQQRLHASRLLTITGAGGCGKTRLAQEVGRRMLDEFPDGVWLIDLAPLSDASLVWQPFATALGIHEEPGRPIAYAVSEYLRDRNTLIILDNCEHLIEPCAATVDRLLREAADLRVVATSRELLGIAGEAAWPVRPLSVVDPAQLDAGNGNAAHMLLTSEAARLFVDRARLLNPTFELINDNALAVAQICYRLDGIPLAIELAAARLAVLSPDELAARLDQRFRLLTGGYRTAVRRQQTLQATIDWSYELLTDAERALLRTLSVFAGGWSLDAAEAVSSCVLGPAEDAVELLNQLVRKSMVVIDQIARMQATTTRYRFLETIRQYAEEKLVAAGEAEAARSRHSEWYVHLAEEAEEAMESADQGKWFERLELEEDNLRAALTWTAAQPDGDRQLLHFAGLLGRFWRGRDHLQEGLAWLEAAVQRVPSLASPSADHVRALNWLAVLCVHHGDSQRGRMLLEQAAMQARAVGDARLLSLVARHLAFTLVAIHEYRRAEELFEEGLGASRRLGNKREVAWNLGALGLNRLEDGHDYGRARQLLEEAIATGRESGDITPVLYAMGLVARMCVIEGDIPGARKMIEEALTSARELRMHGWMALMLALQGNIAMRDSDWNTAEDLYGEAIHVLTAASRDATARVVRHYAALLGKRGEHRRALRLLAAAARIDDVMAAEWTLPIDPEAVKQAARAALGERAFAEAWAEGESMTLAQATAELLRV